MSIHWILDLLTSNPIFILLFFLSLPEHFSYYEQAFFKALVIMAADTPGALQHFVRSFFLHLVLEN